LLAVSLIVALAAAIAAIGTSSATSGTKKPIVIGAAIAKTGILGGYDYPAVIAAQFAVDDINKKGGVLGRPLRIVVEDTKTDRAIGPSAALKTIEKGAEVALVTCDLDFAAPAAVTFGKKNIVAMSLCAGSPNFGPRGVHPLAFSAGIATPEEASAGAEWAFKTKKWRSAYTLVDTTIEYDTTWMENFQLVWKHQKGKLVGQDTFQQGDASIRAQISRIEALRDQPDFIAICSYGTGGPAAVRQIRTAGIDLPLLLCDGLDGIDWLPSVPGLKDTYVVNYGNYEGRDPNPKLNALTKRYVTRVGEKPPRSQFFMGYGAVEMLVEGIKRAGTTEGEALKKALEGFKNVNTISGPTTFSAKWHNSFGKPVTIQVVANGSQKFVARLIPKVIFYPK
jgi:branched-chain amino acid transport system substrate-binding protein